MYQTYTQTMQIAMQSYPLSKEELNSSSALVRPQMEIPLPIDFQELHNIALKENVIFVNSPSLVFDLATMTPHTVSGSETSGNFRQSGLFFLQVYTQQFDSFNDIDWDDDYLYLFYQGTKNNGKYRIRRVKLDKSKFQDAIDRLSAIQNLDKYFSLKNSVNDIRDYVNSEQFITDKLNSMIPIEQLGIEYAKSIASGESSGKIYNKPTQSLEQVLNLNEIK